MIAGRYECIDAHCHVYPDTIAEKAVASTAAFYHVEAQYSGTADELIRKGKKYGIDRFLIFSVATKPSQVRSINRYIAGMTKQYPEFFDGLGTVHPLSENTEAEIDELIELGLHGIKIHPDMQDFPADHEGFMRAYEYCGKKGIPVLTHCGDEFKDFLLSQESKTF